MAGPTLQQPTGANLTGTLSGLDVLGLQAALEQQMNEAMASRTGQAADAAGQASQAYQSAAAAPSPQLSPLDQGLPLLLGGVASILQGNQGPTQRAQEGIQTSKAALLKARSENLAALHDVWAQKADEAQRAGDLEAQLKARSSQERVSNTLATVNAEADRASRKELSDADNAAVMEREKFRAANDLLVANIKAAATGAEDTAFLDNEVKQNSAGRSYLPLTNIPPKAKIAALKWAKDKGIPAVSPKDADKLDKLDIARQNLADMKATLQEIAPKDWKDLGTMTKNRLAQITKSDPAVVNYQNYFAALIEQLVALAGGSGSGLRINQAEIRQELKRSPDVATPLPVALGWADRIEKLINNAEDAGLGRKNIVSEGAPGANQAKATQADRDYVKSLGIK
jgi:hypothetical protein